MLITIKEISKNPFILKDKIFIYPTDTIYGIGCDAKNEELVNKIRKIKQRHETPFSVIAPDKEWIKENCEISQNAKFYLNKLPGPYTLILKLKNKQAIANNVSFSSTIGVRIPAHPITKIISKLKIPIITTSVNLSGDKFMTSLDDLNQEIKSQIDAIIYEGPIKCKPSTVIDLSQDKEKILRN